MKKIILLTVLILLEITLVLAIFSSYGINRQTTSMAFYNWKQNPSPETKAAWEKESSKLRRDNLIWDTTMLFLLAMNTLAIFILLVKTIRDRNIPTDNKLSSLTTE